MDYLLWHYTHGLKLYLRGCGYLFRRLNHFFSFPVLLKTLFSPWKKMVSDDYVGLDIKKVLENLTFNLISIGIGFSVRLSLLFVGFLVALIYLVVGLVGLVLWLFFPFISLGQYYRTKNHDSSVFQELVARIKSNPSSAAKLFLSSPAGKFFTEHLADTSAHDLFSAIDPSTAISSFQPANYQEIVSWIIDSSPTFGHDLRRLGLKPSDFVDLATWWD